MSHYSPVVAALITILLTIVILTSKYGKEIQDIPNERSLHQIAVPRTGGIAMMAGILSGWALILTSLAWWLVLPLIGLFVVSLLDDIYHLPVNRRLLAQLMAAAILVAGSGLLTRHGLLIALIVLLLTVWMTNLYNFMDGSDGLAGGMAFFGFGFYGIAALMAQDETLAMLNFTIAAAALGFLLFNFHPAKIFMGDAGSIPLGFLAAALGMWGWLRGDWALWFPLLVFSPFIMDATITLCKRTLRGAKVTEAHREHYYQRAVQMGWGHRRVALVEYGLMIVIGLTALYWRNAAFPLVALLLSSVMLLVPMLWIERRWQKKES